MRLIYSLIILLFISISGSVFSQAWTRLSPTPQENTIKDITRIPGTLDIIALCEGPTIMKSGDMGNTWNIVVNPGELHNDFTLTGIYFINESTGFAYGEFGTILKSTDGGLTWRKVFEGEVTDYLRIQDMEFLNDSTGLAMRTGNGFFYTTDIGETWDSIVTPVSYPDGFVEFFNETDGIAIGTDPFGNYFMRTTDGGLNWVVEIPSGLDIASVSIRDVYMINDTTGFIMTSVGNNKIYKTIDKGYNWFPCYSDTYNAGSMDFINDYQGIALFKTYDSTKIISTNDAGNTWQEESIVAYDPICLAYINENTAFMGGFNGNLYRSLNDLSWWEQLDQRIVEGDILKIQFLNDSIGYLKYAWGKDYLMKTSDGGLTWSNITFPPSNHTDFHFISADTGFYVSNINFYSTFDGGQTWNSFPSAFYFTATAVEFYDKNHGMVSTETAPYYTHDGGITWQYAESQYWYYNKTHDIEFLSENEVILVHGNYGSGATTIDKSMDGGQTWENIFFAYKGKPNKLMHTGGDTVLLACNTLLRSIDRGVTWTDMNVTGLKRINSLSFPSSEVGYAVGKGDYYSLLKTIDGGITWNPDNLYCASELNDVHFFDENNGLVFGDLGVVLKTSIGGSVANNYVEASFDNYFNIFPNPASDYLRIEITDRNSHPESQITIFNAIGKQVSTYKALKGSETVINVEPLKPGLYFIQLKDIRGRVLQTRKLIRQR